VSWLERAGFRRPRSFTLVLAGWLAAGFIVWNGVFDKMIQDAGREYVYRQQLFERNRGPRVTIEQIMSPARTQAIRTSTWSGLTVAGTGFVLTLCVAARWAARRRRRAATSAPSSTAGSR
jgi:hypothetical protein